MNARRQYWLQIDQWNDRHDVQAYKSTPMDAQKAAAIEIDHAEALEMNTNGDSGRAAFLGISPRETAVLALLPRESMEASNRFQQVNPTEREMDFLVGWLMSSVPEALIDALNALETYRDRKAALAAEAAHRTAERKSTDV